MLPINIVAGKGTLARYWRGVWQLTGQLTEQVQVSIK